MDNYRRCLYDGLEAKIGNTPLVHVKAPNGNTIWIKRECDNPYGSHYDRVYIALFREWEEKRGLLPGANVLESTSGTAGVSFAGIGKELGYRCYVMIPNDPVKQRRIQAIRAQGGIILPTPADEDIQGFTKERITKYVREYGLVFLNHSMGPKNTNNETTLQALSKIADEVLLQTSIDTFIVGMGNGSSIVGPGRVFRMRNPNVEIVGFKPQKIGQSVYPGLMNQDSLPNAINFPHMREAQGLLNDVVLIDDNWHVMNEHHDLGRSSKAGIKVAYDIAKKVSGKNILVIGYDKAERY